MPRPPAAAGLKLCCAALRCAVQYSGLFGSICVWLAQGKLICRCQGRVSESPAGPALADVTVDKTVYAHRNTPHAGSIPQPQRQHEYGSSCIAFFAYQTFIPATALTVLDLL